MPQHKNDMLLVAAPRASMAEVVSVLLWNPRLAFSLFCVGAGHYCCSALLLSLAHSTHRTHSGRQKLLFI